jgi:hypothetical protein
MIEAVVTGRERVRLDPHKLAELRERVQSVLRCPDLEAWCVMPDFQMAPTGESLQQRIALLVWHCSNPYGYQAHE